MDEIASEIRRVIMNVLMKSRNGRDWWFFGIGIAKGKLK
jgi:hypothetical protein